MYNGIGLQTPRGSGTSGYVQKNLSYVKPFQKQRSKDDFMKEMQALKDNILPPPKKANPEIILHQQKRDIQLALLEVREKLEAQGLPEDEINRMVQESQKILMEKLNNGELDLKSTMDTHQKALEKEKEYQKIKKAFNVGDDYKPGSAFDFETQEKKRLENLFNKEKAKLEKLEKLREEKKLEKKLEKQRIKDEQEKLKAIENENKASELHKIKNDKESHKSKRSDAKEVIDKSKDRSRERSHDRSRRDKRRSPSSSEERSRRKNKRSRSRENKEKRVQKRSETEKEKHARDSPKRRSHERKSRRQESSSESSSDSSRSSSSRSSSSS